MKNDTLYFCEGYTVKNCCKIVSDPLDRIAKGAKYLGNILPCFRGRGGGGGGGNCNFMLSVDIFLGYFRKLHLVFI